jgi:hypothetical protein
MLAVPSHDAAIAPPTAGLLPVHVMRDLIGDLLASHDLRYASTTTSPAPLPPGGVTAASITASADDDDSAKQCYICKNDCHGEVALTVWAPCDPPTTILHTTCVQQLRARMQVRFAASPATSGCTLR